MGRIAKILSFVRTLANGAKVSDVKVDPGGGANVTAQHFSSPGDDAHPLATDYAVTMEVQRTGGVAAVGYVDPINEPKALRGDKRTYARDAASGEAVVEVWLQNDGTGTLSNSNGSAVLLPDGGVELTTPEGTFEAKADGSIKGSNGSGSFELEAGGDFLVNGVIIDTNGNITTAGTVNADDITADNVNVTLSTHLTGGVAPTPGT